MDDVFRWVSTTNVCQSNRMDIDFQPSFPSLLINIVLKSKIIRYLFIYIEDWINPLPLDSLLSKFITALFRFKNTSILVVKIQIREKEKEREKERERERESQRGRNKSDEKNRSWTERKEVTFQIWVSVVGCWRGQWRSVESDVVAMASLPLSLSLS